MFKTVIAGATALSLSFTPANAQGLNEEQIGQIIFGLFATAAIAAAIKNNDQPKQAQVWTQPKPKAEQVLPTPRHPVRPRPVLQTLPQRCITAVQSNQGRERIFTRSCIARSGLQAASFPRRCERDVVTRAGFRAGWAVRCMRNAGFRVSGRK